MPETATESDVNAPIKSSLRDAFINNASYEIWAAFQKKFSEGEKPGRPRWDAMMIQRINSPELGQPFQDCAIEAAVEVYELAVKYLRTGGV